MIKAAVNCFVIDPISNIVLVCVVRCVAILEMPYALTYSMVPFFPRAIVIPGRPCCCIAEFASASTVEPNDGGCAAGGGEGVPPPPQPSLTRTRAKQRREMQCGRTASLRGNPSICLRRIRRLRSGKGRGRTALGADADHRTASTAAHRVAHRCHANSQIGSLGETGVRLERNFPGRILLRPQRPQVSA